jgi:hypothetical protein
MENLRKAGMMPDGHRERSSKGGKAQQRSSESWAFESENSNESRLKTKSGDDANSSTARSETSENENGYGDIAISGPNRASTDDLFSCSEDNDPFADNINTAISPSHVSGSDISRLEDQQESLSQQNYSHGMFKDKTATDVANE